MSTDPDYPSGTERHLWSASVEAAACGAAGDGVVLVGPTYFGSLAAEGYTSCARCLDLLPGVLADADPIVREAAARHAVARRKSEKPRAKRQRPVVDEYERFLATKAQVAQPAGFEPPGLNGHLYPFQRSIVDWSLRHGRAAIFADCGLGKTLQQLEWAHRVVEHTGRPVLILAPLAVAGQTVREGQRFGIDVTYARERDQQSRGVTITNYETLKHFDPRTFGGVVLDESGILKSYTGATKRAILTAFADTPYRLAATATPAPNDLLELLNQAEFLGWLNAHEAIARWFTNTDTAGKYRLRHWAHDAFWDWVTSWARCLSKPSDIGDFSDDGYTLPEIERIPHVIGVDVIEGRGERLFREPNLSATKFHEEGRRTANARAERVAELVRSQPSEQSIVWVDTDYDDDAVRELLPDVVSVRGSGVLRDGRCLTKDEDKERAILDFVDGSICTIVAKPRAFGFGLNLQCCGEMVFARPSFSFEATYQAERRCHRFGRKGRVRSHMVMAATEVDVYAANRRKADQHATTIREMYEAARRANERRVSRFASYEPKKLMPVPAWLRPLEVAS